MKLCIPAFENKPVIDNCSVLIVSISDVHQYSKVAQSMVFSGDSIDTDFAISLVDEKENKYSVFKIAECLINPLSIDFASKKIQNTFLLRVKELMRDNPEQRTELEKGLKEIQNKALSIAEDLDVPLSIDDNWDAPRIIKSLGIEVSEEPSEIYSLLESLELYLRINANLRIADYYFFLGLNDYLDKNELQQFYQEILRQGIKAICIEHNHGSTEQSLFTKTLYIDDDFEEFMIPVKR